MQEGVKENVLLMQIYYYTYFKGFNENGIFKQQSV